MAQPLHESRPLNMFETGDKQLLNWYCPCCGTKISPGTVDRLLIIVPPSSRGVKEQAVNTENSSGAQSSNQASSVTTATKNN
eukprot:9513844-Prorocentrum_lima.AAC.1